MGRPPNAMSTREIEFAFQRAVPYMYIVDSTYRVVLRTIGDRIAQLLGEAGEESLPPALRKAIEPLLEDHWDDPHRNFAAAAFPTPRTIARVLRLRGDMGDYAAVFVEEFKARDDLRKFISEYGITPREREVLHALIEGYSTGEIAQRLHIAASTVILHVKSMMSKTHSHSRTELVGRVAFYVGNGMDSQLKPIRAAARD